jgi:hypothetical protein
MTTQTTWLARDGMAVARDGRTPRSLALARCVRAEGPELLHFMNVGT